MVGRKGVEEAETGAEWMKKMKRKLKAREI